MYPIQFKVPELDITHGAISCMAAFRSHDEYTSKLYNVPHSPKRHKKQQTIQNHVMPHMNMYQPCSQLKQIQTAPAHIGGRGERGTFSQALAVEWQQNRKSELSDSLERQAVQQEGAELRTTKKKETVLRSVERLRRPRGRDKNNKEDNLGIKQIPGHTQAKRKTLHGRKLNQEKRTCKMTR